MAVIKHCGEKHLGRNRFVPLTFLGNRGKSGKRSNRTRAWKQRPWQTAAYCLAPYGFLGLFSHRTISTGVVPPTMGWTLTHQSWLKKCSTNLTTVWSNGGNPQVRFTHDYNWCQVDIKLDSTEGDSERNEVG